jgi:hypothetical protein
VQLVVIKSIGSATFIRIAQKRERIQHATTNSNVKVYFIIRKVAAKSGSKYRQPRKLYKYFQNPIHIHEPNFCFLRCKLTAEATYGSFMLSLLNPG